MYEFHLTLLGSLRELTAQATRPLDLYSKYEFHFTPLSSLLSAELTAQGAKRPRTPLLRVQVPLHAVGLPVLRELTAQGEKRPLDLYLMYELHSTLLSFRYPVELTAHRPAQLSLSKATITLGGLHFSHSESEYLLPAPPPLSPPLMAIAAHPYSPLLKG